MEAKRLLSHCHNRKDEHAVPSKKKKIILLPLCLIIALLAACTAEIKPTDTPSLSADSQAEEPADSGENEGYSQADTNFSICYSSQNSMNPLYGTNTFNNDVFSLMYEGLFRLNGSFEPEGVLCTSYYTEDGLTFYFTIRSDVKFHSGGTLTASDAAYSLNKAAGLPKYSSRFKNVIAVNAKDSETLVITLSKVNYSFPTLLDIPIVQEGTADNDIPSGTGPYTYRKSGGTVFLSAFTSYRDYELIPIDRIYLVDESEGDLGLDFSVRKIDALNFDQNGILNLNLHLDYEARNYNTTNLVYIGFNCSQGIASTAEFRRAVSHLVDIDSICSEVLNNLVTSSPLILSPELSYYSGEAESEVYYSRQEFSSYITEAALSDYDTDGFFESPVYGDFTITIIVNSESDSKIQIANRLAASLKNNGISAEVIPLAWTRFVENLTAGTYNIYIGEVSLPADFDLTELLTPGGSLNYGKISDDTYSELISDLLSSTGAEKTIAANALCSYAVSDASIIPIAYKKHTVATHIGAVSGLTPSVSGVFSGITECTISSGAQ